MNDLLVRLPDRPGFTVAFLARAGLGEIVVRRAGKFVSRRYFPDPQPEPVEVKARG